MNKYIYDGPVKEFGTIISERWQASTYAISEAKARSNLIYRYKKMHGKDASAKITLSGKITTGI